VWRGVAWRGVEKSRWATIAASWPHLHCSVHCPRVSLSGTQGRLSFSAGSSADDGSPGEGLGIVGEKMSSLARTGRGTAPRRRSQVACLVSRTAAESRQQRWHLLDDSPIAPPPRRAGFSVMTSRPGCAQRSMFNTHSRLRLLACDIDFHAFPIMSYRIITSSLVVTRGSYLLLTCSAFLGFDCIFLLGSAACLGGSSSFCKA